MSPPSTRHIGLSLGADLCWPHCFEQILERTGLEITHAGERVRFAVRRVTIEPFDLRRPCPYDLVLDRVTHWYSPSREWIKKAVLMDDLYVLNNPWSLQSMEKQTSYAAMMRLGLPVPETWVIPPKSYDPSPDLKVTLERYAELFDLGAVGRKLGYPMFMKPYDGGAWVGVSRIADEAALRAAYEQSGKHMMHLQKAVEPFDLFVRCVGVGPQVRIVRYDPDAPLHGRYTMDKPDMDADERALARDVTLLINTFFGWDFNSCELMRRDGVLHPIDFANACPDSQVTSLHYHFPWLVRAKLRWAIYVATTGKRMRKTLDWDPYYEIADTDAPYREKVRAWGRLADERLETAAFEAFCDAHLGVLDDVVLDYFGTDDAHEAVRRKVASLYPAHEIEEFTELFWNGVQRWREEEQAS